MNDSGVAELRMCRSQCIILVHHELETNDLLTCTMRYNSQVFLPGSSNLLFDKKSHKMKCVLVVDFKVQPILQGYHRTIRYSVCGSYDISCIYIKNIISRYGCSGMQKVKDSWRVVNHRDIIPTVPRLMGYCHVAQPIYLSGRNDNIVCSLYLT